MNQNHTKISDKGADDLQRNYDDLINAVFFRAYEDLVAIRKRAIRETKLANKDIVPGTRNSHAEAAKNAFLRAEWIEGWLRDVLPQWRDLDADKIILRARLAAERGEKQNYYRDNYSLDPRCVKRRKMWRT